MTFTLNEPSAAEAMARVNERSALTKLQEGSPLEGIGSRHDWSGLRCVIYARISQAEEGDVAGVDRQIAMAQERISGRGGTLVHAPWFDNDVSASRFSEKPLRDRDALMAYVLAGGADLIVAYDTSRLHRRRTEFTALLELFEREAANFAVATVFGHIDLTTAHGRFQASMDNSMNIMESEKISYRVRSKFAAMADAGEPRTSRRSFGWEQDGMTPRESEAKVLRAAWRRIIEEGASLKAIARQWEADDVRPASGRPMRWTRRDTSILRMLTNPRHVGDLVHQGEVHRYDAWPGIISREEFDQVVAIITARSRGGRRGPRRVVPYTGLLVCGRCEEAGTTSYLSRSVTSTNRGGHHIYNCRECWLTVRAEPVEEVVREAAFDWSESDEFRNRVDNEEPEDATTERAELERLRAMVRARKAETNEMWNAIPPEMTRADYKLNMARLDEREADVQARLDKLALAVVNRERRGDVATMRADWPNLTVEEQRLMLLTVLDRVVITPATKRGRGFDHSRIHVHPMGQEQ